MGFIIRNHLGDCQAEGQQYIQGKSDDHAIKIGLKVAISRKITHLTLESDSSSIVDLLNKDKTVPWVITHTINDIKQLLHQLTLIHH